MNEADPGRTHASASRVSRPVESQVRAALHVRAPKAIDVINFKKIIINVNKRVYSEKDSKRL